MHVELRKLGHQRAKRRRLRRLREAPGAGDDLEGSALHPNAPVRVQIRGLLFANRRPDTLLDSFEAAISTSNSRSFAIAVEATKSCANTRADD